MYRSSLTESDEDYSGDSGWIPWFCGLKGHEFLAEVDEEYIRDNFNLYGLRVRFENYEHALDMILSSEAPDEEDLLDAEFLEVYRDATNLYGLIHARYVASPRGLQVMREKYLKGTFGTCPRVLCSRQHMLPIGTSEEPQAGHVRVFCPRCEQVYLPKGKYRELDGAFFGTSSPQFALQCYPSLVPLEVQRGFVPRVFGFRVHKQKSIITRKLEQEYPDNEVVSGTASKSTASTGGTPAAGSAGTSTTTQERKAVAQLRL